MRHFQLLCFTALMDRWYLDTLQFYCGMCYGGTCHTAGITFTFTYYFQYCLFVIVKHNCSFSDVWRHNVSESDEPSMDEPMDETVQKGEAWSTQEILAPKLIREPPHSEFGGLTLGNPQGRHAFCQ